jgi:hypothetical protein
MAYIKTNWTDRAVQYPRRYKDQNLIQYTFTPDEGVISDAGVVVNALNLNKMELGIEEAHNAIENPTYAAGTPTTAEIITLGSNSVGGKLTAKVKGNTFFQQNSIN